jgi:hypothetical protein
LFNLVITVLAALVVGMGASTVDPDMGNRKSMEQQAFAGIAAMSTSVSSYRMANAGALPRLPSSDTAREWVDDLVPYLPFGSLPVVRDHGWHYLAAADGSRRICLTADEGVAVPDSTREAFASLVRRSSSARTASDCEAQAGSTAGDVLIVDIRS